MPYIIIISNFSRKKIASLCMKQTFLNENFANYGNCRYMYHSRTAYIKQILCNSVFEFWEEFNVSIFNELVAIDPASLMEPETDKVLGSLQTLRDGK